MKIFFKLLSVLILALVVTDALASDRYQTVVINYLAQPKFGGNGFIKKVAGTREVKCVLVDKHQRMVYFSVLVQLVGSEPRKIGRTWEVGQNARGSIVATKNDPVTLGGYIFRNPHRVLFRVRWEDLIVSPDQKLRYYFGGIIYDPSIRELADMVDKKFSNNGWIYLPVDKNTKRVNHNPYIFRQGEPSLARLTQRIIRGAHSRDQATQMVLDFVGDHIKYSDAEAHSDALNGIETMKKPSEVLMAGEGECSSITILFSSLLNQAGIRHLLLYLPSHIAVAVEWSGRIPPNSLAFRREGVTYLHVEPRLRNGRFIIGRTVAKLPNGSFGKLENIWGVQLPFPGEAVYDINGKKRSFIKK